MTKRGWARHHELKKQDAADKQKLIDGLIADLGRTPTTNDLLAIEDIASLTIWARVLERRGKFGDAADISDQIARARRATNFKPTAPEAPKPSESFADEMLRYATPAGAR